MNNLSLNIQAVDFRNQLINLISTTTLPACVVYYIIKDLYNNVEQQFETIINQEKKTQINMVEVDSDKIEE